MEARLWVVLVTLELIRAAGVEGPRVGGDLTEAVDRDNLIEVVPVQPLGTVYGTRGR